MKKKLSLLVAAMLGTTFTTALASADPLSGGTSMPSWNTCSASAKCKDGSTVSCTGNGSVNAQCWGVDGEGAYCFSSNARGEGVAEQTNSSVLCPSSFPNS